MMQIQRETEALNEEIKKLLREANGEIDEEIREKRELTLEMHNKSGRFSITDAMDVLMVIDGIPQADQHALHQVKPEDLNSIRILKPDESLAKYGPRGANGAILITTTGKSGASEAGRGEPVISVESAISSVGDIDPKAVVVIDGIPQGDASALRRLDSKDVDGVTVLKGRVASMVYGPLTQNGAVVVTTKKNAPASRFERHSGKLELDVLAVNPDVLLVIDGVAQESAAGLNELNPAEVESITVLKDNVSLGAYGDRGKKGVIRVVTKKNPIREETLP